jgi:hypothetical protein
MRKDAALQEISLEDLLESAYPEHDPSYLQLRQAAYDKKAGGEYAAGIAAHLRTCTLCERRLKRIWDTDPLLTGKWKEKVRVLVHATADPVAAVAVESRASQSIESAIRAGMGLVAALRAFFTVASSHSHHADADVETLRRDFRRAIPAIPKFDPQREEQREKSHVATTS